MRNNIPNEFYLANYFIKNLESVSLYGINELVYMAYGFCLSKFNKKLFKSPIISLDAGVIIHTLYQELLKFDRTNAILPFYTVLGENKNVIKLIEFSLNKCRITSYSVQLVIDLHMEFELWRLREKEYQKNFSPCNIPNKEGLPILEDIHIKSYFDTFFKRNVNAIRKKKSILG